MKSDIIALGLSKKDRKLLDKLKKRIGEKDDKKALLKLLREYEKILDEILHNYYKRDLSINKLKLEPEEARQIMPAIREFDLDF